MARALTVARNPQFAKLWSAQILSQIAQNLLNFALIIRVYELAAQTQFANVSVSLLILSFAVPSIFFAAIAGIYVDHWNRRNVLVVTNILRAVLVLGYLVVEQNLWLVLALSFVISAITQFFVPAEAASIPTLVNNRSLVAANSLFLFTLYAAFIVGYSAAAPVLAVFGPQAPYLLTSGMFGLAGLLCYILPALNAQASDIKFAAVVRQTKRGLLDNWRAIRSDQNLYFPILELSLTQTMVGVLMALAPALSLAVLGVRLVDASHVLIIPAGAGMVIGVLVIGRLLSRYSKLTVSSWSLLVAGLCLAALGLSGRVLSTPAAIGGIVALLMLILGGMNAIISVASQTQLQENTTDATRARVFGALNMVVNIAATLPIFMAGILADLLSVTQVVLAAGLLVLGFAVLQLALLYKNILDTGTTTSVD